MLKLVVIVTDCTDVLSYVHLFGFINEYFTQKSRNKNSKYASHVSLNLLKPTGHVMHQQFNIQQLYVLSTLYLCVLYLSENKERLVPLTA